MTNSTITHVFLDVAQENLDQRIAKDFNERRQSIPNSLPNSSEEAKMLCFRYHSEYLQDIDLLNRTGKALAEHGFDYEPIDPETAF